ncbi:MAG: M48 family metalloprotease [Acidobacteriota bacterium]|nr:M48 family metalloprotease [Acidobacteriota bacterium]
MQKYAITAIVMLTIAAPVYGQIGALQRRAGQLQKVSDIHFSDTEERDLGAKVSAQLRARYGVVQDPKVTKYVSLVGTVVAKASSRPNLAWQFVVLDTDAVNAYAAPGGIIHITRGALGLIKTEAELAGVLAHEIAHVTEKHTIKAIQKAKGIETGVDLADKGAVTDLFANKAYEMLFENAFDRGDELGADKAGVQMAGAGGYSATALTAFLQRLAERNKNVKEPNGLFASHPLIKERTDKIATEAARAKPAPTATVQARYAAHISYKSVPLSAVATVAPPAGVKAAAPEPKAAPKPDEKKPSLGVGRLRGALSTGTQKQSTQVSASAGARGVGPDRDAKGGPNRNAVTVRITDAELAAFKAAIA